MAGRIGPCCLARFLFSAFLLSVPLLNQNPTKAPRRSTPEHSASIASVLNAIKVGMSRSDLMKVFTTEGGLSTTSQRTYVYRQCP